jgi:hypothetical protein
MSGEADNSNPANREVEKLWSASEAERQEGKAAMTRLGSLSVDPLVALLKDLIEDPHPRFPIGKELEGKNALDRGWQADRERQERIKDRQGPLDVHREVTEALGVFKEVRALAINSRLLFDVIELLGVLRAEAAVPVLVEILETEGGGINFSSAQNMRPEMIALVKIGPPAVPALIQSIQDANRRVAHAVSYPTRLILSPTPEPSEFHESECEEFEEETDAEDDGRALDGPLDVMAMRLIARAAMVLGAIGDTSALPALQAMLTEKNCGIARHYIVQAIQDIEGTRPAEPAKQNGPTPVAPAPAVWRPDNKKD